MNTVKTRSYRQQARAEATQATRRRIVEEANRLFTAHYYDEVSLRQIAEQAGVAQQTVINHFGTKDAIFLAALTLFQRSRDDARAGVAPDDVRTAVEKIVADYEDVGASNLRALALEDRVPALHTALEGGRRAHREWVEHAFPTALKGLRASRRAQRLAQLCVATDVYTWRLLRHDHGMTRDQATEAMRSLVETLYPANKKEGSR